MKANPEIIEAFNEWQTKRGGSIDLGEVEFEFVTLKDLHVPSNIRTITPTSANRFIEISDIDESTKEYDLTKKIKPNLPLRAKSAPEGTILISRVRPLLGSYTIIKDNGYAFTSGDLNPISLRDDMDVKYVFSAICSPVFRKFLQENQSENGQKPTITSKLYDFAVLIPTGDDTLAIQTELVAFIENQQTKIHGWTEAASKLIDGVDDFGNLLLAKMFQPEKSEDLVELFNHWQSNRGGGINLGKVKFGAVKLNSDKFQFVKGQNKYVRTYMDSNRGSIPVLGSSLKNNCIAAYIKPISASDVINKECVTFNKDNAKGSEIFYRTPPFLMDRHHIAILSDATVFSKYLRLSLRGYFREMNFGWGDNVASEDVVSQAEVIFPIGNNSLAIQKEIVAFIEAFENWKADVHGKFAAFRSLSEEYEKILLAKMFQESRE